MSFTVPLNGCPINATATVMASFSRRQIALLRGCLRRDVVWWWFFPPGGAYDSIWDSVKPLAGKFLFNYFQYHEFVGLCLHAELLVQQLRRNLPRQLQLFPVSVEGQVSQ